MLTVGRKLKTEIPVESSCARVAVPEASRSHARQSDRAIKARSARMGQAKTTGFSHAPALLRVAEEVEVGLPARAGVDDGGKVARKVVGVALVR